MGLELAVFDPVNLKIELDRVVGPGGHRDPLAAEHRDSGEVRGGRGIDDDPLDASVLERLAAQITKRGPSSSLGRSCSEAPLNSDRS